MRSPAILAAILITATAGHADTIRLTTGKNVKGLVTGYANNAFELKDDKGSVTKIPAASVTGVDFDKGSVEADLETRGGARLKRQVSMFNKGSFSVEDSKGTIQRLPVFMVASLQFGGASASRLSPAKRVEKPGPKDGDQRPREQRSELDSYLSSGSITIIDFYADWCGPCRMMGPILEQMARSEPDVVLREINVDNNRELAGRCGVRGIPHIMVFNKDGKCISTIVGADKAGVEAAIQQARKS